VGESIQLDDNSSACAPWSIYLQDQEVWTKLNDPWLSFQRDARRIGAKKKWPAKDSTQAQESSQKLCVASILLALPCEGGGTRHTQRIEAVPTADHAIILDESSSHIARGEGVVA